MTRSVSLSRPPSAATWIRWAKTLRSSHRGKWAGGSPPKWLRHCRRSPFTSRSTRPATKSSPRGRGGRLGRASAHPVDRNEQIWASTRSAMGGAKTYPVQEGRLSEPARARQEARLESRRSHAPGRARARPSKPAATPAEAVGAFGDHADRSRARLLGEFGAQRRRGRERDDDRGGQKRRAEPGGECGDRQGGRILACCARGG